MNNKLDLSNLYLQILYFYRDNLGESDKNIDHTAIYSQFMK